MCFNLFCEGNQRVLDSLARYYVEPGEPQKAMSHLQQAISVLTEVFGELFDMLALWSTKRLLFAS